MTKLATIGFVAAVLSAGSLQPGSHHQPAEGQDRVRGEDAAGNITLTKLATTGFVAPSLSAGSLQPGSHHQPAEGQDRRPRTGTAGNVA